MKVAIFSRTPMAASAYELWKALRKYTAVEANLITITSGYPDGRIFPGDLTWGPRAREALAAADVWHVNNYWHPCLDEIKPRKPILAQFHSLPRLGNWKELWDRATARVTIRQPLHEKEYQIPGLPNIIDADEYRPARRGDKIRIAFAPTSKAVIGIPCTKGYNEVRAILAKVAAARPIEVALIEGQPYERNLEMKRASHILIDDVVTGNFHRTSLEGAVYGLAVVNKNKHTPWVFANLQTLESALFRLIDEPPTLKIYQTMARTWALHDWHPVEQIKEYTAAYERIAR